MKNQIPSIETTQVIEIKEEKLKSVHLDSKQLKSTSNVCTTPISTTKIYEENDASNLFIDEDYFGEYQDKANNQFQRNFSTKNYSSPIWSYYDSSQKYLSKILRANSEIINNKCTIDYYEQSNNYIRKDSFFSKPSNEAHSNNELLLDHIDDIEQGDLMNNNHLSPKYNVSPMSNPYFMPNSLSEQPIFIPRCNSYSYEQKMKLIQNPQIKMPYQNQQQATNYMSSSQNNPLYSQSGYLLGNGNDDPYMTSMFGRMGWICTLCNNFNYESRHKCNRCKQEKTPKLIRYPHILSPEGNLIHNNALNNTSNTNINNTFNQTNNVNVNVNVNINQIGTNPNNQSHCHIQASNQNQTQNQGIINNLNMLSMANNSKLTIYNNNVNINNSIIYNHNKTCNLNEEYQQQGQHQHQLLHKNKHQHQQQDQLKHQHQQEQEQEQHNQKQNLEDNIIDLNNNLKKKGKLFSERNGDWICCICKNVNFSFRISCNRCQIAKVDSDSHQFNNNTNNN